MSTAPPPRTQKAFLPMDQRNEVWAWLSCVFMEWL